MKSKSVCEAEGKPTSISLKPMPTSASNMRSLRSWPIGSISDWLPSRRSTAHQIGAWVMVRDGHCRSGRSTGGQGRYFCGKVGPRLSDGPAARAETAAAMFMGDLFSLLRMADRSRPSRSIVPLSAQAEARPALRGG